MSWIDFFAVKLKVRYCHFNHNSLKSLERSIRKWLQVTTSKNSCGTSEMSEGFCLFEQAIGQDYLEALKQGYSSNFILNNYRSNPNKKDLMRRVDLKIGDLTNPHSPIYRSDIIDILSGYFCEPYVCVGASIWYNWNTNSVASGSQIPHFDRESSRQVKMFIALSPIDEDSGQTKFFSSASSNRVIDFFSRDRGYMKQRFNLDLVKKISDSEPIVLSQRAGDALMIDTSRLLHFGSCMAEKPKHVMALQFIPVCSRKMVLRRSPSNLRALIKKFEAGEVLVDIL